VVHLGWMPEGWARTARALVCATLHAFAARAHGRALPHNIPAHDGKALALLPPAARPVHTRSAQVREWGGLDGLRLNKFYSLIRHFLRSALL
jgi:hypothetical protein